MSCRRVAQCQLSVGVQAAGHEIRFKWVAKKSRRRIYRCTSSTATDEIPEKLELRLSAQTTSLTSEPKLSFVKVENANPRYCLSPAFANDMEVLGSDGLPGALDPHKFPYSGLVDALGVGVTSLSQLVDLPVPRITPKGARTASQLSLSLHRRVVGVRVWLYAVASGQGRDCACD